ncbi:hypothetical protein D3C73_927270 [compost metagenome]
MGSTAASAVPVREKTVFTSGWALMARSSAICMARDCSSEAEGTRSACMAMSPSSSVGMNSRPSRVKARAPISRAPKAEASTVLGCETAARMAGSIQRRAWRSRKVSCSSASPFSSTWTVLGSLTSRAAMAGTKVKEKMKAPTRASMTVAPMGMKVLPSTPSSISRGVKTSRMISWPKAAGLTIWRAALAATPRRSLRVRARPRSARFWPSRSRVFSTTTTAPSTSRPKSSAPRLIRFPLMPKRFMPMTANRKLIGIIRAVIVAARMFPSSRNSTTMTSRAPSVRFLATVFMVELTRALRFSTGSATMSGGRLALICSSRSAEAWATVRLFSPASIRAVPITASWPSRLAPPRRGA